MFGSAGLHNPGGTEIKKKTTPIQILRSDDVDLESNNDFCLFNAFPSSPIMTTPSISPCPHLIQVVDKLPVTHTRQFREECGSAYYKACLELAQSHWLQGRPSQAVLQLDKAMMAQLEPGGAILRSSPIPYQAILWIMLNSSSEQFLGNPVRHFQHLASRMNRKQPQPDLRVARTWCCLHLAESVLDSKVYPRDFEQIERETLVIPTAAESVESLTRCSPHSCEIDLIKSLLKLTI